MSAFQEPRISAFITHWTPQWKPSDVSTLVNPTVTFRYNMDPSTFTNSSVWLRDEHYNYIDCTFQFNAGNNVLTIVPDVELTAYTEYQVVVKGGPTGPKTLVGGQINQDSWWNFWTGEAAPPPSWNITISSTSNAQVRKNSSSTVYSNGQTVNVTVGDTLHITTSTGYEIRPSSSYIGENAQSMQNSFPLNVAGNLESASYTFTNATYTGLQVLVIIVRQRAVGHNNWNNLYRMERIDLRHLNDSLWGTVYGGYDQYIINLLELPMKLEAYQIGPKTPIALGDETITGSSVDLVEVENAIFNIGNIHIPHTYNNSLDFYNTQVTLHLPFAHSVSIPNKYAIGQTLSIEYVTNLYSGDTTINIRSSKVANRVFQSERISLGRHIPTVKTYQGANRAIGIRGNLSSIDSAVYNEIYTAYVEVARAIPAETANIYNLNITTTAKLGDETGYLVVNNIQLQTDATYAERDMIIAQLAGGIHIN